MKEIKSVEEFDSLLENNNLVVDFWASFCGPCRTLAPIVDLLSQQTEETKALVIKVDVEQLHELASRYNIMGIPNIKFIRKGGEVIDEVVGITSLEVLKEKVSKL